MATRHIQPFTYQVWEAEGATIGNQDYSGTPSASIGATSSTFTAPVRNVVVNGTKYRIEFDRWSYTYSGTFPNWSGRITENGEVLSVDNSFDDVDEGVISGTLTVVAHMSVAQLSPGDPHYDDDVYYYVSTTESGDGSTSGGGRYASGASCTITATPDTNWRFVRWESDSGETETRSTLTFTVSQDVVWTAHFERIKVWVRTNTNVIGIGDARCSSSPPYNLHEFNCGDTVQLEAFLDAYYYNAGDWRFEKWTDPDGSTSASASRSFTLTESYIENYATTIYEGRTDKVLDFSARFVPARYMTFKLEIVRGTQLGSLPSIVFRDAFQEFVTVTTNTSTKYEARVPFSAAMQYGQSIIPTVSNGTKYEIRKSDVLAGEHPGQEFGEGTLGDRVEWRAGIAYGEELPRSTEAPNGISIAYYLRYKSTGKLLYGSSGTLLHGSDDFPIYL